MKTVVLYSPFPDGSFVGDMSSHATFATKRPHKEANQSKAYEHVSYDPKKPNQLKRFGSDFRLYIFGHGEILKTYLVADQEFSGTPPASFEVHGKRLAITPETLVTILKHEGLDPEAKDVRLWSCIAAKDKDRFAYLFGEQMLEEFPKTTVYGYSGYMVLSTKGKKRGVYDTAVDAESYPASRFRVNVTDNLERQKTPKQDIDIPEGWDPFNSGASGIKVWKNPSLE